MKIAFTSKGKDWNSEVEPRFGRADYILVYDTETESRECIDNTSIRDVEHGAGPKTAKLILDLKPNVLVTGIGPGGNASRVLDKANVEILTGYGDKPILDTCMNLIKELSDK